MAARRLLAFFALTYAVSWVLFAAAAFVSSRSPGASKELLFLPGAFVPAFVAILLTGREEGRAGVLALLRRITKWNVGWRWYVFAVGFMAAMKLSVAVLHRAFTGAWPRFGGESWYLMLVAIAFSMWFQAGEEVGWRGYALPRLADRFGLAGASLVLGVIWACWHLPFFFIPGVDKSGQSFPLYALQVTAVSVAMAWLYWRTHGSLLLVMLMHASINNTLGIVPSATPNATNAFTLNVSLVGWLTCALLWLCAAYFLVVMRRASSDARELLRHALEDTGEVRAPSPSHPLTL